MSGSKTSTSGADPSKKSADDPSETQKDVSKRGSFGHSSNTSRDSSRSGDRK